MNALTSYQRERLNANIDSLFPDWEDQPSVYGPHHVLIRTGGPLTIEQHGRAWEFGLRLDERLR